MTHWFDGLAKAAAAERDGVSRRGIFAGAAIAAVAASPVASRTTATAARHVEALAAQAGCVPCLTLVISGHNRRARNCLKTGSPDRPRRKKVKTTPVSAAKKLACMTNSRAELGESVNECRRNNCQGASAPPIQGQPGTGGCPPGTYSCNDGPNPTCCYGGDVCCSCPTGTICCVIAVGCTCC